MYELLVHIALYQAWAFANEPLLLDEISYQNLDL